jgi:hypothetical protein
MARDSRGRFYLVTPETAGEPPFVFDETGRFLTRLGRRGGGPGEYETPSVVLILPGDSVLVLDRRLARLTVLSPSYEVVRTAPAPAGLMAATRLVNGDLVLSFAVANRATASRPLNQLDAAGNHLRSFGAKDAVFRPRYPHDQVRWLAAARSGGVWSAHHLHKYVIERWSPAGEFELEVTREADWFHSYATWWLPTPDRSPAPHVMGVWEDDDGRLWVIGRVGGTDWVKGLGPGRLLERQMAYPIKDEQLVYDGFVDVIDPVAGVVLASRRLPGTVDVVVAPGTVGGVRESSEGWLYMEVSQVRLVRR